MLGCPMAATVNARASRLAVASVVIPLGVSAAGCGPDDGWDPDAQFAPSLRPASGVRVTDGALKIWLGRPCEGVTRVAVHFSADGDETARYEAETDPPGTTVEFVDPDGRTRGLEVTERPPADFEWESADSLRLSISGPEAWGTRTDLAAVIAESDEHDEDTYYFDEIGWLDASAVAERDGKDFLTPCTPDPEKE